MTKHVLLISTLLLGLGLTDPATAQNSDREVIEKTIDNYVVGWRTADARLLKEAFDFEAGVVIWADKKEKTERMKSMTLADLAARVKPQEGYGLGYEIQKLEVIGDQIAIAFVKIPTKKSYYIDCLELQKINGEWRIVLKSFVYFTQED